MSIDLPISLSNVTCWLLLGGRVKLSLTSSRKTFPDWNHRQSADWAQISAKHLILVRLQSLKSFTDALALGLCFPSPSITVFASTTTTSGLLSTTNTIHSYRQKRAEARRTIEAGFVHPICQHLAHATSKLLAYCEHCSTAIAFRSRRVFSHHMA